MCYLENWDRIQAKFRLKDKKMDSETQSNEPETQLVEDEARLESKDGLGTSLIPEQNACVADKQQDQSIMECN